MFILAGAAAVASQDFADMLPSSWGRLLCGLETGYFVRFSAGMGLEYFCNGVDWHERGGDHPRETPGPRITGLVREKGAFCATFSQIASELNLMSLQCA